jgi:negative regulator of sigma E activity
MNHDSQNTQAQEMLDQEALSALMDNELSDFELRRLLRSIEHRPDLLEVWERYSLTRAALRSEPMRSPSCTQMRTEFSGKVLAAIASEPALFSQAPDAQLSRTPVSHGVVQNLARLAVAASVTVAVFLGMQALLQDQGLSSGGLVDQQSSPGISSAPRQQIAVDTDAQQRLNEYIRSVSIPVRVEAQSAPYNVLLDMPQLRPVSDRELIEEIERD